MKPEAIFSGCPSICACVRRPGRSILRRACRQRLVFCLSVQHFCLSIAIQYDASYRLIDYCVSENKANCKLAAKQNLAIRINLWQYGLSIIPADNYRHLPLTDATTISICWLSHTISQRRIVCSL